MRAEELIRSDARKKLSNGNWGEIIAATFVLLAAIGLSFSFALLAQTFMPEGNIINTDGSYNVTEMILPIIFEIMAVIVFVLLFPFYLGYMKMVTNVANNQKIDITQVFTYFTSFKTYLSALNYGVSLMIRYVMWLLVCFVPTALFIAILQILPEGSISSTSTNTTAVFISVLLVIVSVFSYFLITKRYFLATYLFVQNLEDTSAECFKKSCKIMRGNIFKASLLWVSYIFWFLLTYLVVPVIYVFPYYKTAVSISGKWMIQMYNDEHPELEHKQNLEMIFEKNVEQDVKGFSEEELEEELEEDLEISVKNSQELYNEENKEVI